MTFNKTNQVKPYFDPATGITGVILPHSGHPLYENDINQRMQKVRKQIAVLINTKTSPKSQKKMSVCTRRLEVLLNAKEIFSTPTLRDILMQNAVPIADLQGYEILERSPWHELFKQRI